LFRVKNGGASICTVNRFDHEVEVNKLAKQLKELFALVVRDLREATA
jgi:translation initiation factor 1 (eIF-1/SUI1)